MFGDLIHSDISNNNKNFADRFNKRRLALLELIAQRYPEKKGSVLLFAPIEQDYYDFLQDSSFYYFSGVSDPANVLSWSFDEPTILYQPDFGTLRNKWIHSVDVINDDTKILYGFDALKKTGNLLSTYNVDPYFALQDYQYLIELLTKMVVQKQTIFTLYPQHSRSYASVKMIIDRLALFVPGLMSHVVDVSDLVTTLRRKKDMAEVELMYQAVEITQMAFQAASHMIKPGVSEAEIQATMDYIFTENGARSAYGSIIGSGKNSTILHYRTNKSIMQDGDVVLIDAGAMWQHYCADITRVFPVSGVFNKRQRDLYEIVLAAQQHVASFAKPGVWLNNAKEQENSLQHIALNFLKQHGYDQYFIHGIGHFIGLDVHDVGSRNAQLEAGDVITIEPGIYIPQESIGIRIEDNYWIVDDEQAVCLSEDIPKQISEIEEMMQQNL